QPEFSSFGLPALELAERLAREGPAALSSGDAQLAALVAPIVEATDGDEPVWIVGGPELAGFPFHACPTANGVPLGERNPVMYVPSASVLGYTAASRHAEPAHGAVVVGDPAGDLPFARAEARAAARHFGVTAQIGAAATLSGLRAALRGDRPAVVHLACHGAFDEDDPMRSALL